MREQPESMPMSEVLVLPGLPPTSPYEAYLYLLIVPFVMRLVMVAPPLFDLWNSYASEAKWFVTRLLKLPIKGLIALGVNEVLALFLPLILAFYARSIIDPLGWPDWASMPRGGSAVLLIAAGLWIFVDFLRVGRTRRILVQATSVNVGLAKRVVDATVKTRNILEKVRNIDPLAAHSDIAQAEHLVNGGDLDDAPRRGIFAKLFGAGKDVGITARDGGLEMADAAAGLVRKGAGMIADRIDAEIHKGIRHHAKMSLLLLMRDIGISLMPILILTGLHALW